MRDGKGESGGERERERDRRETVETGDGLTRLFRSNRTSWYPFEPMGEIFIVYTY